MTEFRFRFDLLFGNLLMLVTVEDLLALSLDLRARLTALLLDTSLSCTLLSLRDTTEDEETLAFERFDPPSPTATDA